MYQWRSQYSRQSFNMSWEYTHAAKIQMEDDLHQVNDGNDNNEDDRKLNLPDQLAIHAVDQDLG